MNQTPIPTSAPNSTTPDPTRQEQAVVRHAVEFARGRVHERRDGGREPMFQPVLIFDEDGEELAGFTRDISVTGVGLLHSWPVKPGVVTLRLQLPDSPVVSLRVKIEWCLPCGDGFYVSGGRFVCNLSG